MTLSNSIKHDKKWKEQNVVEVGMTKDLKILRVGARKKGIIGINHPCSLKMGQK